jgi:hypothetical protein
VAPSRPSKSASRAKKPGGTTASRKAPRPAPKKTVTTRTVPSKTPQAAPKKGSSSKGAAPEAPATLPVPTIPRADGRRHLLSLSFVRDGDEFLARMETDSGHITELKNRALDQLLTLVAGELEDLLE